MKGFLDLCTTNPVVENYILSSAKLQNSHNWATNISTGKKDENGKTIKMDIYAIKGSEESESIHQFLSDNTKVEFGRWDFKSETFGERGVIGTSHQKAKEWSSYCVKSFLTKNNWFDYLLAFDHNHPAGTLIPSPSDKSFIKSIEQENPNVLFRIYPKGYNGYIYFISSGVTATPVIIQSKKL
jgi:hypothetical protein